MTRPISAGIYSAGGIQCEVLTNRHQLATDVRFALRDLTADDSSGPAVSFHVLHSGKPPPANPWSLWRDHQACERTVANDYIVRYLMWEITRMVFERDDRVTLHGAALALDGKGLVLPGRSHVGKSTLAGWLTHSGWGFLTDEAAIIDPDQLLIEPFWRPIGVRRPGPLEGVVDAGSVHVGDAAESLVPASSLGRLGSATPMSVMVFPELSPSGRNTLTPITAGEALAELTLHFPALVSAGRAGFNKLAGIVRQVPAYRLRFGPLDEAADTLRSLVTGL